MKVVKLVDGLYLYNITYLNEDAPIGSRVVAAVNLSRDNAKVFRNDAHADDVVSLIGGTAVSVTL